MSTLSKRRKTFNEPNNAHELTFSCLHRKPFLTSTQAKVWLANALLLHSKRFDMALWAYVYMPEHVHLLVNPRNERYDITLFRAAVKGAVTKCAVSHLRKNNPRGLEKLVVPNSKRLTYRFWQDGPGYDRNIVSGAAVWSAIDYIHGNPVRRGLCDEVEGYVWSSARQYYGLEPGPLAVEICPLHRER
jgi:putative transposase